MALKKSGTNGATAAAEAPALGVGAATEVPQAAAEAPALGVGAATEVPQAGAPMQTATPKAAPKQPAPNTEEKTMSKADWQRKDERISRQGLFQAALQTMAGLQFNQGGTVESYLDLVEKIADRGLEYVNRQTTKNS